MPTFHLSYTARINPAGASPTLTYPQIWTGLQRKIRHAEEFVPVIQGCEVLSDEAGVVKRKVQFKPGAGAASDTAVEVVRSFYPSWVDFVQEDGATIRNIVADGPSGELDDLHMTYMFEIRRPDLKEGSAEAEQELKRLKGMAKNAVESSIVTIREMVKDGRIKD
ncbi:DUF1857-domain-containing protein [Corynespora cassiicola Philippines]|uniref:DUF1857-domain-containing protein n=1 Tax=Corynespora cassiicola Philippines TaxID=1448308 RepID=A0A2T2NU03_CORCC|nr:DUF1857-domain-containing protein [Corynespora cassiicola Philippines]